MVITRGAALEFRGSVRIYLSLRMKLDNKMRIISMLIDVPDMLTKQVSDG